MFKNGQIQMSSELAEHLQLTNNTLTVSTLFNHLLIKQKVNINNAVQCCQRTIEQQSKLWLN